MPTEEQLRNRELAVQNIAQGLPQSTGIADSAINISDLQQTELQPLTIQPTPQPIDRTEAIGTSLQGILDSFNAPTQAETQQGDLQQQVLQSIQKLGGQQARQAELEEEAGLGIQRTELQSVISQLQGLQKEALAIPLQIQQEFAGRGVTRGGVAPIQTSRLRENAIKSLGLAAIGQTLQGNISLAQASIQNALDVEFEPERTRLQTLQQLYLFNKDALERADKRRSDQLAIFMNERDRILEIQRIDRNNAYDVGLIAQQNGAPADLVQQAFKSGTGEQAAVILGQFMQSPQAKQALRNALLDSQLKKINIARAQEELKILREFDGLTPTQYAKKLDDEKKVIQAAKDDVEKARLQGEALDRQIILLDSVLESSAIGSVVGPSVIGRAPTSKLGLVSRIVTPTIAGAVTGAGVGLIGGPVGVAGAALIGAGAGFIGGLGLASQGAVDYFTGSADKLIGQVEQFISQKFLQSLIDVKAQGATFGALQKAEQDALTQAATFIGQRRICDGPSGRCVEGATVVGYDMAEKDFREEFGTIQRLTRLARDRATGKTFTDDENNVFDKINQINNEVNFNPAF